MCFFGTEWLQDWKGQKLLSTTYNNGKVFVTNKQAPSIPYSWLPSSGRCLDGDHLIPRCHRWKKSLQSLAAISCICQVNHIKDYRLTWRTRLTKRAKKNISNGIIIKGMRCQMNAANAFIYSGDLGLYCCLLKMMSKEAWTVYRNKQKIPELYLNRNFLFYKIMSLFISTST